MNDNILLEKAKKIIRGGHIYFHIFFLNVGANLLPVTAYYVVRNNAVFHIDPVTFSEEPTGDNLEEMLNCKPLGEYDKKKVVPYDMLGYIDAKKLADVLAKWKFYRN